MPASAGELILAAPADGDSIQAARGSASMTFEVPDTTARGVLVFNPSGHLILTALDDQAAQSGGTHPLSWTRHKAADIAFDLSW
ncbi:MAG: hypothetical protein AUI14_12255 [Actinobacteria bacterium 13_2_20CM_2_71_6]|nr:MAG: hypothetical protein AUI14_12255 [Actinobacteria bacterium 13_2_20CM_2_71_6]